jgi:hypothetical protein
MAQKISEEAARALFKTLEAPQPQDAEEVQRPAPTLQAGPFAISPPLERADEQALARQRFLGSESQAGMLSPYIGMGKGAASTSLGISRFLGAVPPETTLEDIGISEPTNPLERLGYTTEQILEFYGGGGAARGAIRGLIEKPGMRGILAGGLAEGAGAGTVSMAQTSDLTAAGYDAALDSILAVAFGGAGQLLKHGGRKAMRVAINPSDVDIRQGFDVENIFKYDLQGTIPQMARKIKVKVRSLADDLRAAVAEHGDVEIDVLELFENAVMDVRGSGPRHAFQIAELGPAEARILAAIEVIVPDFVAKMNAGLPIKVGLVDGHLFKQAVGELGALAEASGDLDLKPIEMLSNALYTQLRKAVEAGAPAVRAINKQLSELIPINTALIRELPKDAKRRMFELGELIIISGGVGSVLGEGSLGQTAFGLAGLLFLSKAMRSPTGGRMFHAGGRAASALTPGAGRVGAGLTDAPLGAQEILGSIFANDPRTQRPGPLG